MPGNRIQTFNGSILSESCSGIQIDCIKKEEDKYTKIVRQES